MKYLEKSSFSRRYNKAKLLALAVFVSVFLVGAKTEHAHAIEPKLLESKPLELSPLEKNEVKLKEVEIRLDKKADVVERIADTVDLKKKEVTEVAKTKEQLASQVDSMKNEIELLKQQLAEKKARETAAQDPLQGYSTASRVVGYYGDGNLYDYGYCTWYVKNRRGSTIPNDLGNANTWYYRAQAYGMAVGSSPAAGAVGTTTRGAYGHVVYVESVNGDGTINISEMNAPVFGGVTYRTASASEFVYIY